MVQILSFLELPDVEKYFSGSLRIPMSYGKPDFHGGRTFSSSQILRSYGKVTGRTAG